MQKPGTGAPPAAAEPIVASSAPDGSDSRGAGPPRRLSSRARLALVLGLFVLLLAADSLRAPERQLSAGLLLGGIDLYQATLSPLMPEAGVSCRFHPTCSHYAEGAIRKHGGVEGALRAAGRIARCGPWTPAGTNDPP